MLPSLGPLVAAPRGVPAAVPVAHPVTGHPHLDVPVLLFSLTAFAVVVGVGLTVPRRRGPGAAQLPAASWDGRLTASQRAVRAVALLLLLLCIVAGRIGSPSELDNIAPALVLGAGWPLLFLGVLLFGATWRWIDPWDTAARLLGPGDVSEPSRDVRPAILVAVPLLWYVAAHARPLDPRDLGLALAAYTTVTVAGAVAVGRRRWLSGAEPLGVVLTWLARSRPSWPESARVPRGLAPLMGTFLGGVLFGTFRRTETWTERVDPTDAVLATAGLVAACALGAGLVTALSWAAGASTPRRAVLDQVDARSTVVLAVAPALAGLVVAVALGRNRLFNSVQLLPGLLGDPFGRDWNLLGDAASAIGEPPLGAAGLLAVQLAVLVAAHVWGAVLAARLLGRQERLPAVLLLGQLVAAGVAALSLH